MGYVAVKGGEQAIEASIDLLKWERLKSEKVLEVETVQGTLKALVDQVMSEASFYDPFLAALAIKQAQGSPEEAVFILRAFRSTLPRKHYTRTIETEAMEVQRRISACFKDIPGGQILGLSPDYTHRLLDFSLIRETLSEIQKWNRQLQEKNPGSQPGDSLQGLPKVSQILRDEGLLKPYPKNPQEPSDITKEALSFPTNRSQRIQTLTRGQTGAVTALGYASLRGYGALHPTVGDLRVGLIPVHIPAPLSGHEDPQNDYYIGEIQVTEVEMLVPVPVEKGQGKKELDFDIGYGFCFGQNETKAIAMSLLDQILESRRIEGPLSDEEFILLHIDSVEATGFISHLKLPHYVTFQSKLDSVRKTKTGKKP